MSRQGRCLCGAVRFKARRIGPLGVCHCHMCLRWNGGPFFGVTVSADVLEIEDPSAIHAYRSSDWASRSSCARCGASLWYQADATGTYEISLGLFDAPDGIPLAREIYIDHKPDGYALVGDHPRLDAATVRAMYAPS